MNLTEAVEEYKADEIQVINDEQCTIIDDLNDSDRVYLITYVRI